MEEDEVSDSISVASENRVDLWETLKGLKSNLEELEKSAFPEPPPDPLFGAGKVPTDLKGVLREVEFLNSRLETKVKLSRMTLEHYQETNESLTYHRNEKRASRRKRKRLTDPYQHLRKNKEVSEDNKELKTKIDNMNSMFLKNQELLRQNILAISDLGCEIKKMKVGMLRKDRGK